MQRPSNQDADGTTWTPVGLRLGEYGMDLRRPAEPPALADLLNARFLDERTAQRRNGYDGVGLRDGSAFPDGAGSPTPSNWVYGHGHTIGFVPILATSAGGSGAEPTEGTVLGQNTHYPIYLRGAATFRLGDQNVVWTGDRLLIPQDGGNPALGESTFWRRIQDVANVFSDTPLPRGIPAHLPLINEATAPSVVSVGVSQVDSCLTADTRVYVTVTTDNKVVVTTVDRTNGTILDSTDITGTSGAPTNAVVLSSGGTPTAMWMDGTDKRLRWRYRTGAGWTPEDYIATAVDAYDVAAIPGGFYVLWRSGGALHVGAFLGVHSQNTPFLFGAAISLGGDVPDGLVAIGVDPATGMGVAYQAGDNVILRLLESTAANVSPAFHPTVVSVSAPNTVTSVSAIPRFLSDTSGNYEWIVHVGDSTGTLKIVSLSITTGTAVGTSTRCNCDLASRSFIIGDEVFAWVRSRNSGTNFLLCGAVTPYVSAFADREIGLTPNAQLPRVDQDPADTSGVTVNWTRPFNVGTNTGASSVMTAEMDFLPQLSTAVYGNSAYLSGSCVKNWDGRTLMDAGFLDYPTVASATQASGGQLTALGTYSWNIYAVRYNDQGERFESLHKTYGPIVLTTGNTKVTLAINTMPGTSATDVQFEVYRTEDQASGTAFYLEGTVANDMTVPTVNFVSEMIDATLITKKGDPHAAGVGNPSLLESSGPLGCAILATVGDRLWGAGGQVPLGQAQFSLLKSQGSAAGFDDEAGYVQVDNEGNGVTSVGGLNDATVILEKDRIYVVNGGPDNFGNGDFGVPQLRLAAGAITHAGTTLSQLGLHYWGSDGPLLLDHAFQVQNVGLAVRPLTRTLSPTGVQIDLARMEIVWFCGDRAVLLNYMAGQPRWARWSTPDIAGASDTRLITADGRLLTENPDVGDDGVPFAFTLKTGNVRPEALLGGAELFRRMGVLGQYQGDHSLRVRAYFDGAPMWSEETVWAPQDTTWLTSTADVGTLYPADLDAQLGDGDHSGAYVKSWRFRRQYAGYVSVEVSDVSSAHPTYLPFELSFEVGSKPGLNRGVVGTLTGMGR